MNRLAVLLLAAAVMGGASEIDLTPRRRNPEPEPEPELEPEPEPRCEPEPAEARVQRAVAWSGCAPAAPPPPTFVDAAETAETFRRLRAQHRRRLARQRKNARRLGHRRARHLAQRRQHDARRVQRGRR